MRCNICDYSPDEGSPLLDTPPDPMIKVEWYERYMAFLCTWCVSDIKQNFQDLKDKDIDEYGD